MRPDLFSKPLQALQRKYSSRAHCKCICKPRQPPMDKDTFRKMEAKYDRLRGSNSKSLLRKYLCLPSYESLKYMKTQKYSATLLDCIQSGLTHLDSEIGVYAPDAESYYTFDRLFNRVLHNIHGFDRNSRHKPLDFGDSCSFSNIDPHNRYVISTRIRIVRNIDGFPLSPLMTWVDYKRMEEVIIPVLSRLTGDLKGWYFDEALIFNGMRHDWIENHLYAVPTRFMTAAKIGRNFPLGRGLYHTLDKKFSVWMNFEDHLKIVSMQQGGDVGQVYRRLVKAYNQLDQFLPYLHDKRLGFTTCSPANLGTGLRASVLIRLIKLPEQHQLFQDLLNKHHLTARGTYGYGHPVIESVYDISNKRSLGITEFQAVKDLCEGVTDIMRHETMAASPCECKLIKWH